MMTPNTGLNTPPLLNDLQVLWLKELGIEQLWGHALQAQAPQIPVGQVQADQIQEGQVQVGQAEVGQAQVSQSFSAQGQAGQQQVPQQQAVQQQAPQLQNSGAQNLQSSTAPVSPASTPTSPTRKTAVTDKHFQAIRDGMSHRQAAKGNRRIQRNEQIRQAERPSLAGLTWQQLREQAQACQACQLGQERTQVVFGELGQRTSLLVLDEMPGKEDDLSGHLFDSRSGQLLDNMLAAIGLDRDDVLLTSMLKCRSADGAPTTQSLEQCQNYLLAQIELVKPRCILVLGRAAFSFLQQEPAPFESLRSQTWTYTTPSGENIPVVVSYHPSYLMVHQEDKALAWQDLKQVASLLSLTVT